MSAPWDEYEHLTTYEQRELYEAMSDISETSYCAGWMRDNEYAIWRVLNFGGAYGMCGAFDDPEGRQMLERVRRAMVAADCWIVWDDGPKPIPLDEWRARVAAS